MVGEPGEWQRSAVTSTHTASTRRRGGVFTAALRALWSARTWRATAHALAGLPAGVLAGLLVVGLPVGVWYGTVYVLISAPPTLGNRAFGITFLVFSLLSPIAVVWLIQGFGALQRARFRTLLGVEIPAPSRAGAGWSLWLEGHWLRWLAREWRTQVTWRQLGYHVLSPVIGTLGALLVATCWAAPVLAAVGSAPGDAIDNLLPALVLFLAAPWVAGGMGRVDELAGRALLGPSRSEELAQRVETLARSRADILAATDSERRRIERDLHDGAQQRLVSLAMHLGMARATHANAPEPLRKVIEEAHEEAVQALTELRELVRGLHPAVLDDRGLDAALSGIAARAPVPVRLRVDVARRCSPSIEAVAYFVVSEALTNVAKHAGARSAEVGVERRGDRLRIVVSDDGRGGAVAGDGGGLQGLAQRAAAVDGTLSVSSPAGGPTRITVELPCES
jgi:signal transduction histidine kinase